jgi:hypothetical protein
MRLNKRLKYFCILECGATESKKTQVSYALLDVKKYEDYEFEVLICP